MIHSNQSQSEDCCRLSKVSMLFQSIVTGVSTPTSFKRHIQNTVSAVFVCQLGRPIRTVRGSRVSEEGAMG